MAWIIGVIITLLVALSFYGGGVLQRWIDPDLSDEFTQDVLGEAECIRFGISALGPGGMIKIGEQVLCGYHLEWSNIGGGGAIPKNFAPQPGESNLKRIP